MPHALAAFLASQMLGPSAPHIVTTLHGTDTTLLGQDPDYRTAIEHALVHSDAVTAVSESLRDQTQETFRLKRPIEVIPNFFTPNEPKRSREEVRRDLGITDEFLVLHMSNLRPVKRIDLLLRMIAMSKIGNAFGCSFWQAALLLLTNRCSTNCDFGTLSLFAKTQLWWTSM